MEREDDFDCAAASASAFASHMDLKYRSIDALERIALALELIASTLGHMADLKGGSHE